MAFEAIILAVPYRSSGGERPLFHRRAVSAGRGATSALPDRLGVGGGFLDLRCVLRFGAADSLSFRSALYLVYSESSDIPSYKAVRGSAPHCWR